jgi:hypothetical protein
LWNLKNQSDKVFPSIIAIQVSPAIKSRLKKPIGMKGLFSEETLGITIKCSGLFLSLKRDGVFAYN